MERGGHLRARRRRRGLASDARRPGGVDTCRAIHPGAGAGNVLRRVGAGARVLARRHRLAWSAATPAAAGFTSAPSTVWSRRSFPAQTMATRRFSPPMAGGSRFSPDGRLKKVALAGGAPVTLADAPSILGGTWIDREIIFAGSPSGGLKRVSAEGGEPRPLTTPREADGEIRHAWPSIVPNTRVLLFTIDTMPIDGAPGVMGALSLDAAGSAERHAGRTLVAGVGLARAAAPTPRLCQRLGARGDCLRSDSRRGRRCTAHGPLSGRHRTRPRTLRAVVGRIARRGGDAGAVFSASAPGLAWWSRAGFQAAADEVPTLARRERCLPKVRAWPG